MLIALHNMDIVFYWCSGWTHFRHISEHRCAWCQEVWLLLFQHVFEPMHELIVRLKPQDSTYCTVIYGYSKCEHNHNHSIVYMSSQYFTVLHYKGACKYSHCFLVLTFHLQSLKHFMCNSCWCSNFVSADWTSESAFCFGPSSGELPQTGSRDPSAALQQDRGQVCVVEQTTKFVNSLNI